MVAPAAYPVTITVNDVDVTTVVDYRGMSFDDNRRQVSTFSMTITNPSGVTPTRGHEVVVTETIGNTTIFVGYIVEIETSKIGNGILVEYRIECADRKILLQKSVVPYSLYSGTDASILSSLLSNAYPDLSSSFDFSSGVTNFADALDFSANEESLLDLIERLSELANDADYRFENVDEDSNTVTFDMGGYANYTVSDTGMTSSETTGGNPGNCFQGTAPSNSTGQRITVIADFAESISINKVITDYYADITGQSTTSWDIQVRDGGASGTLRFSATINSALTADGTWRTDDTDSSVADQWNTGAPYLGDWVRVQLRSSNTHTGSDIRLDNIAINSSDGTPDSTRLVWDDEPDAADFNIDVQSGDEFASDITFTEGDWDDYNSVTVIGGSQPEGIDWTYESDGEQDHINLETEITDIAVYENTGSDMSPTWTLLDDGVYGTDELSDDGGSKDVLYDAKYHWLYLDSNAPNLAKAIRVTGNILKPIRVRVEDVPSGVPTYATTITDESIGSIDQAVAIGQTALDKRSAIKRLDFKTPEPGLKVGQSINVSDSARGLDETLVIQRITTQWLGGSGNAVFHVYCGDDDESGADTLIANNDKRSRENAQKSAPTTQTANILTDVDGERLIDTDGSLLYEVT